MATTTSFLLATLLLLSTLPPSSPFLFSNYRTLLSLSHSLTTRVANLRAARGDHAGAARATHLSNTLKQGLGFNFFKFMFSISYDYIKNYAFTTSTSPFGLASAIGDLNELISSLTELTRIDSPQKRAAWISRNHKKLINVSKGLIGRFVKSFRQPGPLKDLLEALQKEVVDGELLKDCLQLGSDDLVGLVKMIKDIATQYYGTDTSSKKTDL